MNNQLFQLPEKIPSHIREVPMYHLAKSNSYSRRDKKFVEWFENRVKEYADLFEIRSDPEDMGDMILLRKDEILLRIYLASDSIWWTNAKIAYGKNGETENNLPTETESRKIAESHLKRLGIKNDYFVFDRIDYNSVAISDNENNKPKEFPTAIITNYRFVLDNLPVFGPGAKLQICLGTDGKLGEFLYFWREPQGSGQATIIHPIRAIEIFSEDIRFKDISPEKATVNIDSIQLGYYAMPPFAAQMFSLPVYQVKGFVVSEDIPRYPFLLHVLALDLNQEELKIRNLITDGEWPLVF